MAGGVLQCGTWLYFFLLSFYLTYLSLLPLGICWEELLLSPALLVGSLPAAMPTVLGWMVVGWLYSLPLLYPPAGPEEEPTILLQ